MLGDMSSMLGARVLEAVGEEPAGDADGVDAADELEAEVADEAGSGAVIPVPGLEDFLGRALSGVDLSVREGGGDPEHPDYPVERLASRSWELGGA